MAASTYKEQDTLDEYNAALALGTLTGYATAKVIASRRSNWHDHQAFEADTLTATRAHERARTDWERRYFQAEAALNSATPRKSPPQHRPDWETEIPTAGIRNL